MTVKVWMAMLDNINERYGWTDVPFSVIQKLNKTPKKSVHQFLSKQSVQHTA